MFKSTRFLKDANMDETLRRKRFIALVQICQIKRIFKSPNSQEKLEFQELEFSEIYISIPRVFLSSEFIKLHQ